jgi:hypothetical protein
MGQPVIGRTAAVNKAPAALDLKGLPHTIGYNGSFPVLALLFAVFFGFCAWASDREQTETRRLAILVIFGVLTALCLWAFLHTWLTKVRLEADRAVARGLFGSRTLMRSEIAGVRRLDAVSPAVSRLVPAAPGERPITLNGAPWRKRDAVLEAWVEGFPDLTEPRADAPVVWQGDPRVLRRASLWLNILAVAVGVWGAFFPFPYALAIIAAAIVPWLGVAAVRMTWGAIAFDAPRGANAPTAAFVLLAPLLPLVIRPLVDKAYYDWLPLDAALVVGALAAMGGFLALFPWMRAGRRAWWFGPAIFGAAYAFGVFANADTLADRARPQVFQTEVVDKSISTGRSRSYHVKLAPWGPRTTTDTDDVTSGTYDDLHLGGRACVTLHPGALGVRWYTIAPCS